MRTLITAALSVLTLAAPAQLTLRPDVEIPDLPAFEPLPPMDPQFTLRIHELVEECELNRLTSTEENPDGEPEWSSVCVVDLSDPERPRVGGWQAENMVYPASTYKLYVLGEAIRQVCAGELSLGDTFTVAPHNVRDEPLVASQEVTLSELLRLITQHSNNTAANVAIDIVDRQRASALLRAMGLEGSDVTRKFLSRSLEDEGYADIAGTQTCALHLATFLWTAETGAIGGGRGRGLIRAYLAMDETVPERMRAGLPPSATLMAKAGWWRIFHSQAALVEDGETRYILAVLTAMPREQADARIAEFTRRVHAMLGGG